MGIESLTKEIGRSVVNSGQGTKGPLRKGEKVVMLTWESSGVVERVSEE
jgi:hypothetical protein